jgi:hypothetical protein
MPIEDLLIEGESAVAMAEHLLEVVLALVGPEKTKALVDEMSIKQGNEVADVAEKAKFGN